MNLTVSHFPVSESPYHILVKSHHSSCVGELTRDPRHGPGGARSILRINQPDFTKLLGPLKWPAEQYKLVDEMRRGSYNGSIRAAKGRVLEIGARADDRLAIAVHKHGPVPSVLIPDSLLENGPLTIEGNGAAMSIKVAVYPDFSIHAHHGKGWVRRNQNGFGTVVECLQSYQLGLDVMLLKYLEDVAEDLYDIEHHLSFISAVRRARMAEDTLATSVKTKLEQVRTHFADRSSWLHNLALALFDRYDDWIILASHARIYVLFMLNEFYKLHDIRSQSKYLNDWNALRARAIDWMNSDRFAQQTALSRLIRSFGAYQRESLAELDSLMVGEPGWVLKLISFARYVLGLKADRLRPATPRVFFSGRHNSPETATLFLRIKGHFQDSSSQRPVEVSHVESTPPGDIIDSTIKRRISASHALIAVIARENEPRLDYIIKEVEQASRGDEAFPVRPLIEDGVNLKAVQDAFGTYSDYFPPIDSRIDLNERQRFLRRAVEQVGFLRFREQGNWVLSAELERNLNRIADAARERFVFDRIHGLVQFLTHEHRLVLKFAMRHGGRYLHSKEWLCLRIAADMEESVSRVENLFEAAWVVQKKRALTFDGAEYTLFTKPKRGKYQANIRFIIRRLWPALGDGPALDAMVGKVIDGIE